MSHVFQTPELITSLAVYSELRRSQARPSEDQLSRKSKSFKISEHASEDLHSVLLVQIYAAADYYTTNQALMEHVPPVLVDIILDPYLLNVFPRSLVPTATYLVILAISGWYLAKYIAKWLKVVARTDQRKKND